MARFSIIMPVKAVNDFIRETVPHVQRLTGVEWELFIIADEAEKSEWPTDPRITVISSGHVGPADKRDLGSRIATGEILVFLDDDSYPEPNLLEVGSQYFADPDVVAVGGPGITPPSASFWQRVSGAVFLSRFTGGAPERYISVGEARCMDDWPSVNLMVRRSTFLSIGGFDCKHWPGEDTKLCLKLKQTGKKLVYAPDMIVWHHRRAGLVAHLKQIGAYGLHRGYFARHYPETSLKIKYFAPTVFTLLVLITPFTPRLSSPASGLLILGWIVYGFVLLAGLREANKFERLPVILASLLYIPLTHFYYGLQFVRGYVKQGELISRLR